MYEIVFRTRFERVFKKLDKKTQKQLFDAIEQLAIDPFKNPNVRPVSGVKQKAYRLRVGRWRVLYFVVIKDRIVEVIDLFIKKSKSDYQGGF